MLEFIDAPDPTIALRIAHRIEGKDLDVIMDRLDRLLAGEDKVNVFVETHTIDAIELAGLGRYMARAMPLFGKLARFGRVAVVADQAWIRLGTRIESAILPFISYRTFTPAERDEALAWVIGEAAQARVIQPSHNEG